MAGRVHEVEDIVLTVICLIIQAHGLRLDGDTALFFDVHRIEHLLGHFARLKPAGLLNQPVGKRRFAMVNMRHDGEITDMGTGEGHACAFSGGRRKRQGKRRDEIACAKLCAYDMCKELHHARQE